MKMHILLKTAVSSVLISVTAGSNSTSSARYKPFFTDEMIKGLSAGFGFFVALIILICLVWYCCCYENQANGVGNDASGNKQPNGKDRGKSRTLQKRKSDIRQGRRLFA